MQEAWGHDIDEYNSASLRIIGGNIQGIQLTESGGKLQDLSQAMIDTQAEIACWCETNADTNKYHIIERMNDTVARFFPHSTVTATSSFISEKIWKPGGTVITSRGRVLGRVKARHSDDLGRWATQIFQGRGRDIAIISTYQPCVPRTEGGHFTVHNQQRQQLRYMGRTNTDPRTNYIDDLTAYVAELQKTSSVIIMGDFNDDLSNASGMVRIIEQLNLIDVHWALHGSEPITTCTKGRRRLDYTLCTQDVQPALRRSGYESIGYRYSSDHRMQYVDIDYLSLFGTVPTSIPSANKRKLNAKHIQAVTKYVRTRHKYMTQHNMVNRVRTIEELRQPDHEYVERFDRDLTASALKAENDLPHIEYNTPWSKKIHQATNAISLWESIIYALKRGRNISHLLRTAERRQIPISTPTTVAAALEELTKARRHKEDLREKADQFRQQEQMNAIGIAEVTDREKARILRTIHKAEQRSRLYRRYRNIRGGVKSQLTSIEVPEGNYDDIKQCQHWKTIVDPEQVSKTIIKRNQQHFGQAHGTPFTVSPLSDHMQFTSHTAEAAEVLCGVYPTEGLDEYTALFLHNLRLKQRPIDSEISVDQFWGKIKNWKEATSTSPSGLHLGHYHAMVQRHSYSNTESPDKRELDAKQRELLKAHVAVVNYCIRHNYVLNRWKDIVNVMIRKDATNSRINRLRVLHIYEADYQLMTGVKWREALHQAEDHDLLNDGAYGSRPRRSAKQPVFIEEMEYEITRMSRKSLSRFDNDAASCYDRIIPNVGALASRSFGVHDSVATVSAYTLQDAKYRLKTQLGISNESYTHSRLYPIYGTGQGSGNSPIIWLFIGSVLFDCHNSVANGAIFESPDRQLRVQISMTGYVDDNTGQTNDFMTDSRQTVQKVRDNMRDDAQAWGDLLAVTGQALELSKCSFHHMHYDFDFDGTPQLRGGAFGQPISLHGYDNTTLIKQLDVTESHKTLGHWKSPAGAQGKQLEQIKTTADQIAKAVQRFPMGRTDARLIYHTVYVPAVTFPLSNCYFTEDQLRKAQSWSTGVFCARMGYNRMMSKHVLYAPEAYGGAGLHNLFHDQVIDQIQAVTIALRDGGLCGDMFTIALKWAQYQAGVGFPIFEHPKIELPHLESKWITRLRDACANYGITMEFEETGIPEPDREDDQYLMDIVLRSKQFSPCEIRRINYCRMYLGVETLADISNVLGTSIDWCFWHGATNPLGSINTWHKVHQANPGTVSWKTWRRAYRLWATADGKLLERLGPWYEGRRNRARYAYRTQESLYLRTNTTLHQRYTINRFNRTEGNCDFVSLPLAAVPADIRPLGNNWLVSPMMVSMLPSTVAHGSFRRYIMSLQHWERDLLSWMTFNVAPEELQGIFASRKTLYMVSDGSAPDGATFGWVAAISGGQRLIRAKGPAHGLKPSSFRAEAYGMLSMHRALLRLREYLGVEVHCQIQMYCDNLALVRRMSQGTEISHRCPEYDVVKAIRTTLQELQLPRTLYRHVRGHQDTQKKTKLTYPEILNVEADQLAENAHEDKTYRTRVPRIGHNPVQLHCDGGTITNKIPRELRTLMTLPPLIDYTCDRNEIDPQWIEAVDWNAQWTAIRGNQYRQPFIVKLIYIHLPVRHKQFIIGSDSSPICPCCDQHEYQWHLMRCSSRSTFREEMIADFNTALQTMRTHPGIQTTLLRVVTAWMQGLEVVDRSLIPTTLLELVDAQSAIGWYQFFLGRIHKGWGEYQDGYYRSIGRKSKTDTGTTWASKVAKFMFEKQHQVWKDRNLDVHGRSPSAQQERRTEVIRELVREYDRKRYDLTPSDRDLVPHDVEAFLRKNGPKSLRQWAITTGPLIQQAYRRAKGLTATGTESIKAYFGYGSSIARRAARPEQTGVQLRERRTTGKRAGTLPTAGHASLPSKNGR